MPFNETYTYEHFPITSFQGKAKFDTKTDIMVEPSPSEDVSKKVEKTQKRKQKRKQMQFKKVTDAVRMREG